MGILGRSVSKFQRQQQERGVFALLEFAGMFFVVAVTVRRLLLGASRRGQLGGRVPQILTTGKGIPPDAGGQVAASGRSVYTKE